jgi:hypothetical protein
VGIESPPYLAEANAAIKLCTVKKIQGFFWSMNGIIAIKPMQ